MAEVATRPLCTLYTVYVLYHLDVLELVARSLANVVGEAAQGSGVSTGTLS